MKNELTLDIVIKEVSQLGFKGFPETFDGYRILIECCEGHKQHKSMYSIRRKFGCRICANTNRALKNKQNMVNKIEEQVLKRNGMILVGYTTYKTKLTLRCCNGHMFSILPSNLLSSNKSWCPACAIDSQRLGLKEMQRISIERGGLCLSTEYVNWDTNLLFECAIGHRWEARPGKIKNGHWCHECNRSGKRTRKKLKTILSKLYPIDTIKLDQRNIPWLIGPGGGRMEIDFLIELSNTKIAIEYDGKQHFEHVGNWESVENIIKRDQLKNKLMAEHKNEIPYFLRIPYTVPLTTESILNYLQQNNIPITTIGV